MSKISEDLIKQWYASKFAMGKCESEIFDRITYIFSVLRKVTNQKGDFSWYFDGAAEGEVGEISLDFPIDMNGYIENFEYGRGMGNVIAILTT